MVVVPPIVTPKTSNAIPAFFKNMPFPFDSAAQNLPRPAYRIALVCGGVKNRAVGAERNPPLRK
jgi:hypothetical protein